MKHRFLLIFLCATICLQAQIPNNYYNSAYNKKGYALRVALHNIISNHTTLSYNALWDAYKTTDKRPDNGKVWDIYSDRPNGTPAYYFTFGSDQCGNYSTEGDCYNREHSVPQSWFNDASPMKTDLFHVYPTDGKVNGQRGNYAYGEVNNATWTSTNGSKLGSCATAGYSGTVFEPIDDYKGDLARSYFYMAVCYMNKNLGQETQSLFSGGSLKPWALNMLIRWHNQDPVSQKEIDRNNAVYSIQHNRNPFIDYPELVGKIFGSDSINMFNPTGIGINNLCLESNWRIAPNPAHDFIHITPPVQLEEPTTIHVLSLTGQILLQENALLEDGYNLNVENLPNGLYLVTIQNQQFRVVKKIVKN